MNASTTDLLVVFELSSLNVIPQYIIKHAHCALNGNIDSMRRVARWLESRANDMAITATKLEAKACKRSKKGGK